ncbi:potassium channel family protein [Alkalimarinus alittae]|uniref:Potassium channel family protein n=1 Tax=Alkalimarinus alittae TaxID=2961619 RepID=A0ABY6N5R6_9ALTE|nr:potassium channel family protein [Alkalimarinus alittae]UZE97350.1 potassium channel family protein [Alkalimarinus alittae]
MFILTKLRAVIFTHFLELKWQGLALSVFFYVCISYLLLHLAGEDALTSFPDFPYWLIITASTVGYGDLSPSTTLGKLTVSIFVVPFGLSLFALFIGRVAAYASFQWRKGVKGLKNLDYSNHILVIGWNEKRTIHLIKLLLREQSGAEEERKIALCTKADIENPLPNDIGFVKVESYSDNEHMQRAGIDSASSIIIDTPEDDITMTTALFCNSRNPNAHMIAYFQDDHLSQLLKVHCPNIECAPSVDVELIVKAAMYPGSSELHHDLLNVEDGMTQYAITYPKSSQSVSIRDIFIAFKEKHDATIIAIAETGSKPELNPSFNKTLHGGATIYYIADERIDGLDWNALYV